MHAFEDQAKSVFYVGNFKFPNGNAGAHRVLNIGKCLRSIGYNVKFFGTEHEGRPEDSQKDGTYVYEGFSYVSTGIRPDGLIKRVISLFRTHLLGLSILRRVKSKHEQRPDLMIAYQPSAYLLLRLIQFCSKAHIPLIADTVEWYDPGQLPGGYFSPFWLDSEIRMRYALRHVNGMLCISSFLEDYYREKIVNVLRVPALVDCRQHSWKHSNITLGAERNSRLKLAFVGSGGKKEALSNVLKGLILAEEKSKAVEVLIVGPLEREITKDLGDDSHLLGKIKAQLIYTGRLPHNQALEILSNADFSLLVRPDQRFTKAGFPTKLGESLANGVPIICNKTSDMGLYLTDGVEGIVLEDASPRAFAAGLSRALSLSPSAKQAMRKSARIRAERSLDYRNYEEIIKQFLEKLTRQCSGRAH